MLRGFDLVFDGMYTPNFSSRITEGKVKEGESNITVFLTMKKDNMLKTLYFLVAVVLGMIIL